MGKLDWRVWRGGRQYTAIVAPSRTAQAAASGGRTYALREVYGLWLERLSESGPGAHAFRRPARSGIPGLRARYAGPGLDRRPQAGTLAPCPPVDRRGGTVPCDAAAPKWCR